jgi:DNA-binding MarR family transcriptional regulator
MTSPHHNQSGYHHGVQLLQRRQGVDCSVVFGQRLTLPNLRCPVIHIDLLALWKRVIMTAISQDSWMVALLRHVRSGRPELTNRQMALLMIVYETNGPHTVRNLAFLLNVSKPVISRSLDKLCILHLIVRLDDPNDKRNIFVGRTRAGDQFLNEFCSIEASEQPLTRHRPLAHQSRQLQSRVLIAIGADAAVVVPNTFAQKWLDCTQGGRCNRAVI